MEKSRTEHNGIIGKYFEDDFPVIVKFVNELPSIDIQRQFTSLTVVSWKYEGYSNNGMPPKEINEKMIILEDALSKTMEKSNLYYHAYSRTGNNLKEFVYYSNGLEEFMPLLNEALKNHDSYPIEIDFYKDADWLELKKLLEDFKE